MKKKRIHPDNVRMVFGITVTVLLFLMIAGSNLMV